MPSTRTHERNIDAAHQANRLRYAKAASEDPVKLGRAVRIVRAALAAKSITLDDLINGAS
jgi:hypothetical protein